MIQAAGCVVVRDGRVLLIHRERYDDWSLPKGKLEAGETWEDAAAREVWEETGLRCELGEPLGSTHYAPGGHAKEVRWFRMTCDGEIGATVFTMSRSARWIRLSRASRGPASRWV